MRTTTFAYHVPPENDSQGRSDLYLQMIAVIEGDYLVMTFGQNSVNSICRILSHDAVANACIDIIIEKMKANGQNIIAIRPTNTREQVYRHADVDAVINNILNSEK